MRALIVEPGPAFSVMDVCRGYEEAFGLLGWDTKTFELGNHMTYHQMALGNTNYDNTGREAARLAAFNLRAACFDFWPDLLVITSGFFLPPECFEIIRSRRIKIAVIFTESPYEDDGQKDISRWADVCTVNDPTNLDSIQEANPNTIYLPHAYRPMHTGGRTRPELASDFCFVGTGYPSRVEFFEAVDFDGIDVALGGNWQELADDSPLTKYLAHDRAGCLENSDTLDYYKSCQVSANIYRTEAQRPELSEGWAMGPREVELAASGTFFLTEERGENREILPMVPTFSSPEDFGEKLRWWLAHPESRQLIVDQARAAVRDRTFVKNAQKLLTLAGF